MATNGVDLAPEPAPAEKSDAEKIAGMMVALVSNLASAAAFALVVIGLALWLGAPIGAALVIGGICFGVAAA